MQTPAPSDFLNSFIGLVSALSIASERVVAVIKNLWPWLRHEKTEAPSITSPGQEEGRRVAVTLISYGSSLLICRYAFGTVDINVGQGRTVSAYVISFLALGGSAFWAQIIGVLSAIKDVKQRQADASKPRLRTLP